MPLSARMIARVALVALLALATACEPDGPREARPGRGRGPDGVRPTSSSPSAMPPPPGVRRPEDRRGARRPPPLPSASRAGGATGGGTPDELAVAGETEAQRLARALATAFGTPTGCIAEATRDRLDEQLRVTVRVRVTESGRVIDADVDGAQLGAEDLACMTRHAESLRLPGPIEGAPRTVTTEVRYAVEDTRVSRTEQEVPDRGLHPGTVDPDSTLPAAGTESRRPAGWVAPSSTLPASTERGRPAGFVPPSSTLPAIGE